MARSAYKIPFIHRAVFKKSINSKIKLPFTLEKLLLDKKAKFLRSVAF
jgi:hypothetical protein